MHGHVHGLPYWRYVRSSWLPEALPGLLLLLRGERTDLMTFGTQPAAITNPNFDTDTGWSKGAGWTISGGHANCVAAADTDLAQASTLVTGHHYSLDVDVTSISGGTLQVVLNSAVIGTLNSTGYQTVLGACNGSYVKLRGNTGVTASVDRVANFANRSITQVYGCAGSFTHPLVQDLNVAYTPYGYGGVIGCAGNDFLRSVAAPETWTPLHRNYDWYFFAVATNTQANTYSYLIGTGGTGTAAGARISTSKTNKNLTAQVGNGTAYVYNIPTPVNTYPENSKQLIVVRHTAGSPANLKVYIGSKTALASANASVAFDATTEAQGIGVFNANPTSYSSSWTGTCALFGVGVGTLTDTALDQLGQYCNTVYGTPWS